MSKQDKQIGTNDVLAFMARFSAAYLEMYKVQLDLRSYQAGIRYVLAHPDDSLKFVDIEKLLSGGRNWKIKIDGPIVQDVMECNALLSLSADHIVFPAPPEKSVLPPGNMSGNYALNRLQERLETDLQGVLVRRHDDGTNSWLEIRWNGRLVIAQHSTVYGFGLYYTDPDTFRETSPDALSRSINDAFENVKAQLTKDT